MTKLLSFECVIAIPIREHVLYELCEKKPSGLLLVQKGNPIFPEKAARIVVEELLSINEQPEANTDWAGQLEEYRECFDRKDEEDWRERSVAFARKCDEEPTMKEARNHGGKALLSEPEKLHKGLANCVEASLPEAIAYCGSHLLTSNLVTTPEGLSFEGVTIDKTWTLWRGQFTMGFYRLMNAVDAPDAYTHERLNQRMDRRYVEYLWPGGILATKDKEMTVLARLMSPEVRILCEPPDIESL